MLHHIGAPVWTLRAGLVAAAAGLSWPPPNSVASHCASNRHAPGHEALLLKFALQWMGKLHGQNGLNHTRQEQQRMDFMASRRHLELKAPRARYRTPVVFGCSSGALATPAVSPSAAGAAAAAGDRRTASRNASALLGGTTKRSSSVASSNWPPSTAAFRWEEEQEVQQPGVIIGGTTMRSSSVAGAKLPPCNAACGVAQWL